MSSDFAKNWYTKVFECAEYEYGVKILVRTFFDQKTCFFGGWCPQKSDGKQKSSDFDEIWHPGVFEGADFKNVMKLKFRTELFWPKTYVFGSGSPKKWPKSNVCPILMKFGM